MVLLLNTWIGNIMLERLQERRFAIFSDELEGYKWDAMASAKLYCSSIEAGVCRHTSLTQYDCTRQRDMLFSEVWLS